jgi:hypothetical protein
MNREPIRAHISARSGKQQAASTAHIEKILKDLAD